MSKSLVWVSVVSSALASLALLTVSICLWLAVRARPNLTFIKVYRAVAVMLLPYAFAELLQLFEPVTPLSVALSLFTALVSMPTAIVLVRKREGILSMQTTEQMSQQVAEANQTRDSLAAQLRRTEAQLRRLGEAGAIGLIVTDMTTGEVLEANDRFLNLVGATRDELEQHQINWRALTPPELLQQSLDAVTQLRAEGITSAWEKEYFHRGDGHRVPVMVGAALLDPSGERALTYVLDLSERKRSEAAIAALQKQRAVDAKFRALLESAPDAMIIADGAGTMELVNEQTEKLFGYAREELVGRRVDLLLPNRDGDFSMPATLQMGSGLELHGRRKDGTEFPVEMSVSPLVTDEGLLVSSAIRDVSARKVTEAALRASNKELEAFSYSVAHDLRTPLRGINGFAKVLADDSGERLDDEGRLSLKKIQDSSLQMGALIDALLSLARVSRSELRRERIDLSAVARSVSCSLQQVDPARAVEFCVQDELEANTDPTLARTLLENLLGNAWKFTRDAREPRIEFGALTHQGRCAFFVRDNGVGFDMAFSGKLFTTFQRLHTSREFPGTGIGLATCHRIVDRHGGRIWAEAEVSRGATFYFSLPESRAAKGVHT